MRASRNIAARSHLAASPATGQNLKAFRRALLRWYDRHRRDLPWRQTRDPYAIWLSEIMLQQTRVAAVLDHYRNFLERFPNVPALAAASEETVLAAWSGLGYYQRARRLHRCAQQIAQRHDGCFPRDLESLLALPGIGRYTAAAIASIAFAEPVAVVDGNVARVLQRLIPTGSTQTKSAPTKSTRTNPALTKMAAALTASQTWQHAQTLLDPARPGDFNQAMMELGATLCLPRQPRCLICPVRQWCAWQWCTRQRRPSQEELPRLKPPSRQTKKQIWCALEFRNNNDNDNANANANANGNNESKSNASIRLVRRSRRASLMPGMWELPQASELPHSSAQAANWRALLWRTFRHSITTTDYTVHVLRNDALRNHVPRNDVLRDDGLRIDVPLRTGVTKNGSHPRLEFPSLIHKRWIPIGRVPQLPLTGLTRKILKAGGII